MRSPTTFRNLKLTLSEKCVQIWSYFWSVFSCNRIEYGYGVISGLYFSVFNPNAGKYGPEITPYLDTFHAV